MKTLDKGRFGALAAAVFLGTPAFAQTPPIRPNTPDVVVPPPIQLAGPRSPDPDVQGHPLTADDAVAIALRRQPDITIAQSDVLAARGRLQQARSGLLPQFGLTASGNTTSQFRGASGGGLGGGGSSRGFTSQASLGVDQLIFDFGRTIDQVRQSRALERAAGLALTRAQQELALTVKQAFYGYAQDIRLVSVAEENVSNRQAQLAEAEARLNSGLGAPADLVRAKTSLAGAVIALTNAQATAQGSRITLAFALGVDPRTPINPAPSEEPAPATLDLNALVDTALADRPDVKQAREFLNAARIGVSVANKTNVPSVFLSGTLAGRGTGAPLDTQSGTLGLSLQWTFGDGGERAGRVTEARAGETAAAAQLKQAEQQAVADVSQALLDLQSAEQRLTTAQVAEANARELVGISVGRYRGEIGTFLEVTDAQASLFTAQQNVVQTQADVQRGRAALARAIGRLR